MLLDLTKSFAVTSLVSQSQPMDLSNNIGSGASVTIEGPEIATYKDLLQRFVSAEILSITLGQKCRSCKKLEFLTFPRIVVDVDFAGKKLWFVANNAFVTISFNISTFLRFGDVSSAEQNHVALMIKTSVGVITVIDRHRYVWAAILNEKELKQTILDKTMISVIRVMDIDSLCRCAKDNSAKTETVAEALCRSHVVSGIGPRLASEGLYAAKISPWRVASSVYEKEWECFFMRVHDHWWESRYAMLAAKSLETSWTVPTKIWCVSDSDFSREKCARNFVICWSASVQH